ncbi:MAG: hypothetical protein KH092_05325 [Actinomyces sp.]|nr:hypothetical protein [Actinomyces sp.]
MKSLFRMSLPVLAVAALATACNPFAHKTAPQYPKDPRFSEFVFHSDEEPTVKDQTDSVNVRWPNMEASKAHLTIAYSSQTGILPDQDPEFWLTAVATVPDETIQLLAEGETTNTLLPGIYPHLYEYVPQECQFTTIDPEFADKALVPDKEKIPHDFGPMDIQALAMSEECHLLVFTALGHS